MGARVAPPIPETVFGRDAGHKRGDDHVTRSSDAMDRDRRTVPGPRAHPVPSRRGAAPVHPALKS